MKKYFIIFIFLAYTVGNYAQIINPQYDRGWFELFHPHIDKVELTNDSTKVYCSINFQEPCMYNIPRTMFIEDLKNKKKYIITKCIGLPFEPETKTFDPYKTYHFVFCFPYIDNLQKFNLIEDSLGGRIFNVYGIDLFKTYPQTFNESEYTRFKNMSNFYKSSNNNKYVEFENKELLAAQYIFGNRSLAASTCYRQLADYYDEIGDYTKAIYWGTQALECDSIHLGVENKEYPVYANTLGSLSWFYYRAGKDDESLEYRQKCIRIRRNIEDKKGYINELINLLLAGHNNDGFIKRISIARKELDSLPNFIDANSLPIAEIYKRIAVKYSFINENDKAIEYCNKAISIMNSTGYNNGEEYAEILGLKCKYQQRSGLKDEAIASGEAAKLLYESLNAKSLKYAELLENLAWAYGLDLNFEKSIQLQTTAADIYQSEKEWISVAEVYSMIGHFHQRAERLDNAELYIKKAIDILNQDNNIEQHIKDAVEASGNNPFILASIKQRIYTNKSNFLQELARVYQKQGNLTAAIKTELESGKIIKEQEDTQRYAVHLITLSQYYSINGQPRDAMACCEQSIKLLNNDNSRILSMVKLQAKLQLAISCFEACDTIKAIRHAEESVSASNSLNDTEYKITALSILSYLYCKNHQFNKAESCLSEHLDYLRNLINNELAGMTTEQKQRLWNKCEHNFIVYRNIIEKSDKNADLLSKLFNYTLFSKSLLLDFDIQHKNNNISRLNIDWKDIQQHLSNDAIAIEFIATKEDKGDYCTYHALIIDKNSSSPKMITLYSESKLEEIMVAETRDIRDIVGKLIWEPILEQYAKVKDIYFSPDGILHILPIEYYSVDDTNSMFELYNMYRLSSTKEIVREKEEQHKNSAVLFGGLDYNQLKDNFSETNSNEKLSVWRSIAERGGFEPLFNTTLETQEIKKILTGKNITTTLFSGETGTEKSFRNLSGQSHNIIHLATHGMYIKPDDVDTIRNKNNFDFMESLASLNDPVKEDVTLTHSFLVMAGGNRMISRIPVYDEKNDGILTSKEISQLDLKGLDLVVLSACESALGDISEGGVYGLQRGFKKAGANTILMSLSKVDDEATKTLMVEFYRNLMNGKTKRQSLLDAQQHLRNIDNGKYDAPKYWGAFIMLDGID